MVGVVFGRKGVRDVDMDLKGSRGVDVGEVGEGDS